MRSSGMLSDYSGHACLAKAARFLDNPLRCLHPPNRRAREWSMICRCFVCLCMGLALSGARTPAQDIPSQLRDVQAVAKEGAGSPKARAAWDRLVQQGPAVLPQLLSAMDTSDTVV